jgi:hypothetical protein
VYQRGFADARFAGHERNTAASLCSGAEPFRQLGKTSIALEQFHRMRTRTNLGQRLL